MNYAIDARPIGTGASVREAPAPCRGIRWHVFHARTAYERQADLALRRLGMETYLPLQLERWHGADRHIVVVFPGYTFARFDVNGVEWGREAVSRQGCGEVGRFLLSPTTRMPASVPDGAVDALRRQCASDGVIYPDDWIETADGAMHPPRARQVEPGDRGKVLGGPMSMFSGICSRSSQERVWLLLSVMGHQTEVGFKRDAVELVA